MESRVSKIRRLREATHCGLKEAYEALISVHDDYDKAVAKVQKRNPRQNQVEPEEEFVWL